MKDRKGGEFIIQSSGAEFRGLCVLFNVLNKLILRSRYFRVSISTDDYFLGYQTVIIFVMRKLGGLLISAVHME